MYVGFVDVLVDWDIDDSTDHVLNHVESRVEPLIDTCIFSCSSARNDSASLRVIILYYFEVRTIGIRMHTGMARKR